MIDDVALEIADFVSHHTYLISAAGMKALLS
jgi:hypothetical protein